MSYELDESNLDGLLVNHPAPDMPKWFIDKLIELGGKQLDGSPNLKVVWGQSETKFACGREMPKYPSQLWKEDETHFFRLRNVETGEARECTLEEFMEAKKQPIDSTKDVPEFRTIRTVTWIGIPRFIIEQYTPVVMIKDSPANWERNRYDWWWNPETRRNEWTDVLGPFPYNGRYDHFLTVKEDDGTHNGKYKPLTEDTLSEIRQAIQARENYRPQTAEIEIKTLVDKQKAVEEKSQREITEEIEDSLRPHLHRMYDNLPRIAWHEPTKK